MTEEEVAVRLENHEQEIKSLKHRMGSAEEQRKEIQELTLSVKELTINVNQMVSVQEKQGERLAMLEAEPAKAWSNTKRTIFNAILSATGAALAIGIFQMMAEYIK